MRRLVLLLFVVVLAVGGWLAWTLKAPLGPSSPTLVLLRPGYSSRRIALELRSAGVIRSAIAFRLWHYLHPARSLKAGEYLFERSADIPNIHDRLRARGYVIYAGQGNLENKIFRIANMTPALWVIAVISTLTVIHRIQFTWQQTHQIEPSAQPGRAA